MKCPEITQAPNRSSGPTRPDNTIQTALGSKGGPEGE